MRTVIILALLAAAALPAVDASHCTSWSTAQTGATTSPVRVLVVSPETNDIYVVLETTGFVTGASLWEETNDIPGLQRPFEACHAAIVADQLF